MSPTFGVASKCGDCAFWIRMDKQGGNCRRCAPRPTNNANDIAHWPRTDRNDACGEWLARSTEATPLVFCRECVYWEHMPEGIQPTDLQDQFSDWWRDAGKCLRFPPAPSSFPGNRAFWRATHQSDGCSEGRIER